MPDIQLPKNPKIVLINPPDHYKMGAPKESLEGLFSFFPLGLGMIFAVLEKEGYNVVREDLSLANSKKEIYEAIKKQKPDVVGTTCSSWTRFGSFLVMKTVKEVDPGIVTIIGGPHATVLPEHCINHFSCDYVVRGEGEQTIVELMDSLQRGTDLSNVMGIAYNERDHVKLTDTRPFIQDLDSLSVPKYKRNGIETSRGCPYHCNFCSSTDYWGGKWRFRSPEKVVDELEMLNKNYGIKHFYFVDDNFTVMDERVLRICREISERKMDISWEASTRVNTVKRHVLTEMKKAGCNKLTFGVESGSSRLLKAMGKEATPTQIRTAFKITREVGINSLANLIVGYPGEDAFSIQETINVLDKANPDHISIAIFRIPPHTPVEKMAKDKGFITDEFWLSDKAPPKYTAEWSYFDLYKFSLSIQTHFWRKKGLVPLTKFVMHAISDGVKLPIRRLREKYLMDLYND